MQDTTLAGVVAVPDGVHVAISVSDEGRGVPPELLPHLFRKHAGRAAEDRERGGGRHGLGLAHLQGAGRGSRKATSGPRAPARATGRR